MPLQNFVLKKTHEKPWDLSGELLEERTFSPECGIALSGKRPFYLNVTERMAKEQNRHANRRNCDSSVALGLVGR